jgi:hypothetical protein
VPSDLIFAKGGVVRGGFHNLPKAAQGQIFQGAQPAIIGDNPSAIEAAIPLIKGPNGVLGISSFGSGLGGAGDTVNVFLSVSAIDSRGVEQFFGENQDLVGGIVERRRRKRPRFRRELKGR